MKPAITDISARNQNGFQSPITLRLSIQNQLFEATTPDLFDLNSEPTNITPALRKSLGVQDLDVSWSSDMATPQNPHRLPCPEPPNITPEIGIRKLAGCGKSSNLCSDKQQESVLVAPKHVESPSLFDESPCGPEPDHCRANHNLVEADIVPLFPRRNSAFIYPEPVKIQITPQRPREISKSLTTEVSNAGNPLNDISPIVLSQRRRKHPKEIRKSLKFMADSSENSSESSSATDSSYALEDEKDMFVLNDAHASDSDPHAGTHVNSTSPGQELLKHSKETKHDFCNGSIRDVDKTQALAGFATASGKNVKVSNEALVRARALFEEEVNIKADFNADETGLSNQSNTNKCSNLSTNVDKLKNNQKVCTAIGFSTASGKNLAVSDKALARAKVLFEGIEDSHDGRDISPAPEQKPNKTLKVEQLPVAVEKKTLPPKLAIVEETKTKFVGFSTAGGKKVDISSEAIQRAQKLFDSIDSESSLPAPDKSSREEAIPEVKESKGFQTANGRSIKVSNEALARSKKMFEELAIENEAAFPSKNTAGLSMGFQSASGKNVTVSDDALKKARALFDNLESENCDTPSESAGLKAASGKSNYQQPTPTNQPTAITKGSLSRPRTFINDANLGHKSSVPQNSVKPGIGSIVHQRNASACGFSTAGGKSVTVSEKALARAKKLFEETEKEAELVSASESEMTKSESQSSRESCSEASSSRKRKSEEEIASEEDEPWVSSPTIGKKRKKNQSPQLPSTPISGTPLSAFDNAPTCVSTKVLVLRRKARDQQTFFVELKRAKKIRVVPKPGRYLESKRRPRSTIKQLIGKPHLPKAYKPYELLNNFEVLPSVCLVTAANSNSFNFYAWEHFSIEECRNNTSGFQLGDFSVILSDDNIIGCEEIGASMLASEHVDPNLINMDWIRNHYRWIVWKLASMELKIPNLFARNCLTPLNVLEQLKYRYDVEIDNCKRSALKRIIEQDDTAAKTMVLCVAQVRSNTILELTDGWYSIDAHCDPALSQLIEKQKVFVGSKLIISGAELVAPGATTPLEKGSDTYLKISANSTRRAHWDLKLGFFKRPLPFPVSLKSILPEGGVVSHTKVIIVRAYPVVYMEKAADGKTVFHSERHYRRSSEGMASKYERMMEQIVETVEREEEEQERKRSRSEGTRFQNFTDEEKRIRIHAEARKRLEKSMQNMKTMEAVPLLKLRVIDKTSPDCNSAIVSIWRPTEELQSHLKEGRCYHLYNVNAAGLRFGELQLNSVKHTAWKEIKNEVFSTPENLARIVTRFETACQPSFKPPFNELDVVGLVVYVGEQQAKGPFQTVVLSDGSIFFGVKCWSSLEEYSLADIVKTGTFLAFSNLQWRTTASRTTSRMPFAFIHEGTIVSSRPALKHIASALEELKKNIPDVAACISESEEQMVQLLGNTTPHSATPKFGNDLRRSMFTPAGTSTIDARKETPTSTNPTVSRARLLEKYGNPPSLTPLNNVSSPHVRQKFKPPARKSLA